MRVYQIFLHGVPLATVDALPLLGPAQSDFKQTNQRLELLQILTGCYPPITQPDKYVSESVYVRSLLGQFYFHSFGKIFNAFARISDQPVLGKLCTKPVIDQQHFIGAFRLLIEQKPAKHRRYRCDDGDHPINHGLDVVDAE